MAHCLRLFGILGESEQAGGEPPAFCWVCCMHVRACYRPPRHISLFWGCGVRVAQRGRHHWLAVGPPRFCGGVGRLRRGGRPFFFEVRRRASAAAPIRFTRMEGPKIPWQVGSESSSACRVRHLADVPWRRPGLRSALSCSAIGGLDVRTGTAPRFGCLRLPFGMLRKVSRRSG